MSALLQDIRYAIRILWKSPNFTLMAVVTLALGIGANTAMFSVINAVLLRPFPYKDIGRLMLVSEKTSAFDQQSVSYMDYQDWLPQQKSFTALAAFKSSYSVNLMDASGPSRLSARLVSSSFFSVLGVQPALGRDFQKEDDRRGAASVAIISNRFWKERFGGDPSVVGRNVALNGDSCTIIGVLPANFAFHDPRDVFLPLGTATQQWITQRESRAGIYVIGRLKTDVSIKQAQSDMDAVAAGLQSAYPQTNKNVGIAVNSFAEDTIGGDTRTTLYLLFGAVGFVLLIACANVANLLLARGSARFREIAVRTALGAGRWRVARQLLTESVLLSILGGIGGALIAVWGTGALVAAVPGSLPRADEFSVDWHLLAYALAASLVTGIIFGLAPAFQALRTDVQDALVVVEVALALILLIGSGLTLRSLIGLSNVYPGFDAHGVMIFNVSFAPNDFPEGTQIHQFFDRVVDRLKAQPGVEAAALTDDVPIESDSEDQFWVTERARPAAPDMLWTMDYLTGPDYFQVMKLHLLRGRFFNDQDRLSTQPVAVIDEVLAKSVFPNEDPVGKHLAFPYPGIDQNREIIGVVGHVKHWGLGDDDHARVRNQIYAPIAQIPDALFTEARGGISFVMRSSLSSGAATQAIRTAVREADPHVPVWQIHSMESAITGSLATQQFASLLLGIFAGVAFLLAGVGIYGVMAYAVTQRTHEIGIRMAIGARPVNILRLVVGRGMILAAIGLAAGLAGAWWMTRLLSGFLYGIGARDPITFGAVAASLAIVALLACYIPARRAMKVDPMIALRYE
jgi:putative ABC transport system permease protein